jgi:hypothetical protein
VTPLNSDASPSLLLRALMTMVGRYATPEADLTITHHLPPPEDESAQDVSVSFVIPPQADASNLLDQNYDDFFSGPGFASLSTPALTRHLANTTQSVRKVAGTIQMPAVLSGQTLTKNSTTELDPPNYRTELQDERHIPAHSLPSLSPSTKPSGSTVDPGPPRPDQTTPSVSTESSRTQPGIQSMSASDPSLHSTKPLNAQITRQFPTSATQTKTAQPRGKISVKPKQTASKSRSGDCETTARVSHVRFCQQSSDLCECRLLYTA